MPARCVLALSVVFVLAACAHQSAPRDARTAPALHAERSYTVLFGGNRAGRQVVTTSGRQRTIDYEFNDRGRGPKTHTVLTLDDHGIPVAELTTGNDYYKGPIDERVTLAGGMLRYSNRAELGEGPTAAFYVGMFGPPEEVGLLARALIRAGRPLQLLPAGEASISHGETVDLGTARVTRVEIAGLGFTPQSVWLDQDGELFATVSSWSSVIRDGFEGAVQTLIDVGEAAERRRTEEVARRVTRRPASIAITNARLFDPVSMTTSEGVTVVIRGNRIIAVGPAADVPADALRIDASGKTVIPGLWDMHVHLSDIDGLLDIASGVTSVRDLANDIDYAGALTKRFNDGTNVGPRVLLAGLLDGPGPYAAPTKMIVDSEDEIRKAIDRYASLGYVQVKIYSSIRPDLVPFIASYAHGKGLRVSGHVPAFMNAERAIRDGFDEVQHANMLLLNFLPDVRDTRTPVRFTAIGERGATIDLKSAAAAALIALLKEKKTVIDPTVAIFEEMLVSRPGVLAEGIAPVVDRLPPQVRRQYVAGGLPVDARYDAKYRAGFAKVLELVGFLHANGITIVAGTDSMPGLTLHRELELYVRAGIPAPEVLRIATLGAAQVMHRDNELGSIAPGKLADLVVIDGDPTRNISDIRKPLWVVKDGLLFDSREVYAAAGMR